jgi:hypothetical protein
MAVSPPERFGGKDRRAAPRRSCLRTEIACVVTGPPDQKQTDAVPWNISPAGACVVVEPLYLPGERLSVALGDPADGTRLLLDAEVRHTILCPSSREMWLTGCSFLQKVTVEDLPGLA